MATVQVTFTPLPAHVRTARLIATAVARRSGVDESLLDEVRLAVGEACSRAVEAHRVHCPQQPIKVALTGDRERFEVVVTDAAPAVEPGLVEGEGPASDTVIDGIDGLALIAGLADDVRIGSAGPGTSIAMSWKQRVASGG
jgi:anti-sigma regulatory factor (Ser/Thr protein kinase)